VVSEIEAYRSRLVETGYGETEHVLVAHLCEKKLEHWVLGERRRVYPVSSGKRPRSCVEDSLGTPWGLHRLCSKHGEDAPPGMVFRGRVATGCLWKDWPNDRSGPGCLVTTRILRLEGLESGVNRGPGVDTFNRYIYIHGTNHPDRFPEDISAGCLLMRDPDLLTLFDSVPVDTHVWLSEPA